MRRYLRLKCTSLLAAWLLRGILLTSRTTTIAFTSSQSHHRVATTSDCECCPETPKTIADAPSPNCEALFTPSWSDRSQVRITRSAWDATIPWKPNSKGLDESISWEKTTEPAAAERFLSQISRRTDRTLELELLQRSLVESFESFVSLAPGATTAFKARIVTTRGTVGTKCPRWHADHVPVRWIQSLVGPGCDYVVGERGVDREQLNGNLDDELSTMEANRLIVDSQLADVRKGREGQAIVLLGHENELGVSPAIHKSPTLLPYQGRALLTIDIVRD